MVTVHLECVCDKCGEKVHHHCSTCQDREYEAVQEDKRVEEAARDELDKHRRAIPGVEDLEDLFEVEIELGEGGDEESGPDGSTVASIRVGNWLGATGEGKTAEEAVKNLRAKIAADLRKLALDVSSDETDCPLSLSPSEVRATADALAMCERGDLGKKILFQAGGGLAWAKPG